MTMQAVVQATHRALVMTDEKRMALEQRNSPTAAPGQVVIDVIATGICGSDTHGLAGDTGRRSSGQVMGHETVGTVIDVGEGVGLELVGHTVTVNPVFGCGECPACIAGQRQQCPDGWVLGVRPDVDGAFADRLAVPATNVVPLPADMVPWHGALVEPLAVGYHAVMCGTPTFDDRVVVIGGGPIGQAAALACRREGVTTVIVSEPDSSRCNTVRTLGFDTVTPDELATAVGERLDGSATLVIDAVGTSRTLETAFEVSAPNGRVVLVGMAAPRLEFAAYQMSAGERTLIGVFCYSAHEFSSTVDWLALNPDLADSLVDRIEPLEKGVEVFDELLSGRVLPNKVLLMPHRGEVS